MPRPRAATQCPAMARDTDTDTAATTVRRKRAGGKERRSASSREKTKEEGKGKEAVEEKMAADIQEELTQKLENLLERDRLGVSMRLLDIPILQTNRHKCSVSISISCEGFLQKVKKKVAISRTGR